MVGKVVFVGLCDPHTVSTSVPPGGSALHPSAAWQFQDTAAANRHLWLTKHADMRAVIQITDFLPPVVQRHSVDFNTYTPLAGEHDADFE